MRHRDSYNNLTLRLRKGSSVSTLAAINTNDKGYAVKCGGGNTAANIMYRELINIRFILSTSGWTGEETVGLKASSGGSSYRSYINHNFSPFVIMYSI